MMRAERFRQVRNLFDAALERDKESRDVFLKEACRGDQDLLLEVGRLLAEHGKQTTWIDESVIGRQPPRMEGRRFGAYDVLRQLGEGGMGAVYLAARTEGDLRQLVALKIVRPEATSEEVVRRFRQERKILESLDHPNIARILDGGTTETGLPFLVMEYVEGESIDSYCDRRQLDLTERLKLFRSICSAVQYAHERHVIHRDLKPTNILVTDNGTVKLLDFGIAKLSASTPDGPTCLTHSDLLLMTPEYASPEQVGGGSITPATDVYSLGVVLYELLTGQGPYRLTSRIFREIARVICEEPPTPPSTAVRQRPIADKMISNETIYRARATSPSELQLQLAGDIDCILLKALEKDPVRRYRSVVQFSEDVRLHLEGLAVKARRHAVLKTAIQLVVRYPWLFIAPAVLCLAVYTGLVVVTTQTLVMALPVALLVISFVVRSVRLREVVGTTTTYRATVRFAQVLVVIWLVVFAFYASIPQSIFKSFITLLLFSAALLTFFNVFRWTRRTARLGQLLLTLSHERRPSLSPISILLVGVLLGLTISRGSILGQEFEGFLMLLSLSVRRYVLHGVYEVRQRGLVLSGTLLRWSDVRSYSWAHTNESDVLRVRGRDLNSLWGAFPPIAVRVRPADRETVNSILEQQLGEWPS